MQKRIITFFIGISLIILIASCSKQITCPTYATNEKEIEKI